MNRSFRTDSGIVVPAVTTDQMIEVDRLAMHEIGPNLFQMMENAGRNLALQAIDCLGERRRSAKIVVLAGTGGNGGGGICAARHLANHGANVALYLTAPDRLREVPAWQYRVYRATAGRQIDAAGLRAATDSTDLVIDALIGYSLRAAPRGAALDAIKWAGSGSAPILALDVPSGIDATTGRAPGASIRARWTMTLALPKTGLQQESCGALWLADIGIPAALYAAPTLSLAYRNPFDQRYRVPLSVTERD